MTSKELGQPRETPRSVGISNVAAEPTGGDRPARQADTGVGIAPETTNVSPALGQEIFACASFFVSQNWRDLVFNPSFSAA